MNIFSDFNWMTFALGILFAIFVMPLISQILGRLKGRAPTKAAA